MKLPFQNSFQIYATPIIKQMRVKKYPKIIGHFIELRIFMSYNYHTLNMARGCRTVND